MYQLHFAYQDQENLKALPVAHLILLTYNTNRGKDQTALESVDDYLPYSYRWKEVKSLELVKDFSPLACQEILEDWTELNTFFKSMLIDFKIGMEKKKYSLF